MSTIEITNGQLDAALLYALHKPIKNKADELDRMLAVATTVVWYQQRGMFYPPMNAVDSETFHHCCDEARKAGLMK